MITPETLQAVSTISLLSFGLALVAGVLMGVSPASFPAWSVVVGYVLGGREQKRGRAFLLTLAFVLGIATVYTALGAFFAVAGQGLQTVLKFVSSRLPLWNGLIGLLLLLIGLHMARLHRFNLPSLMNPIIRRAESPGGAYILGIPFGLAACPSCTPMLLAILVAAGASRELWYGASMLFVFSIGFGLPLLALATAASLTSRMERLARYGPKIERFAGWLLIVTGLYFLWQALSFGGML